MFLDSPLERIKGRQDWIFSSTAYVRFQIALPLVRFSLVFCDFVIY